MYLQYRALPSANRLCTHQWQQSAADAHRVRVDCSRPQIDNDEPQTYSLILNRSKKEQQQEDYYARIDRENRLLLAKMSYIMRTNNVDNIQTQRPRSLNAGWRKKELRKIMDENSQILKRITERKAVYHRTDWERHEEAHTAYLENIREKPMPSFPHWKSLGNTSRPGEMEEKERTILPVTPQARILSSTVPPRSAKPSSSSSQPPSSPQTARTASGGKSARGGGGALASRGQRMNQKAKMTTAMRTLSQEGKNIDGVYVIVSADEVRHSPSSASVPTTPTDDSYVIYLFRTYNLDTMESQEVSVSQSSLQTLPSFSSFEFASIDTDRERLEALSAALMARLSFIDGTLVFRMDDGKVVKGKEEESRARKEWEDKQKRKKEKEKELESKEREEKQQELQQAIVTVRKEKPLRKPSSPAKDKDESKEPTPPVSQKKEPNVEAKKKEDAKPKVELKNKKSSVSSPASSGFTATPPTAKKPAEIKEKEKDKVKKSSTTGTAPAKTKTAAAKVSTNANGKQNAAEDYGDDFEGDSSAESTTTATTTAISATKAPTTVPKPAGNDDYADEEFDSSSSSSSSSSSAVVPAPTTSGAEKSPAPKEENYEEDYEAETETIKASSSPPVADEAVPIEVAEPPPPAAVSKPAAATGGDEEYGNEGFEETVAL